LVVGELYTVFSFFQHTRRHGKAAGFLPNGTKKSAIAFGFEDIDSFVGKSSASLFKGLETGIEVDKAEFETEGRWKCFESPSSSL
jgi:hypothetical protein